MVKVIPKLSADSVCCELLYGLRVPNPKTEFDLGWNSVLPRTEEKGMFWRKDMLKTLIVEYSIHDEYICGRNAAIRTALRLPAVCAAKKCWTEGSDEGVAREIKIMEQVDCPGGDTLQWITTISDHAGQATECFDKNDNEIYEGHILRVERKLCKKTEDTPVFFADGAFWVRLHGWTGRDMNVPLYQLAEDDGVTVEIVDHCRDIVNV